ncbi:translocation/assembly module TamB domain-containing protein [Allorhizobium undicola]|uniref:translocation/assembly module TamB domain-containing protein n=1 Tax=Allorhizobium undicola TaxID=78527 RepID=UPI003D353F64
MRALKAPFRLAGFGLLILLAMLALALGLAGATRMGSQMTADFAASLLSKPGRIIEIDNPSGLLTGELKVSRITLSDQSGPYLDIRDVFIDWSPLALLSRRVEATSAAARSITLERRPPPQQQQQEEEQTPSQAGFNLPVTIHVERVDVPSLKLEKPVMGAEAELALTGRLTMRSQGIESELSLSRARVPDARLNANLSFDPAANRLDLDASLQEPRDGILANLLQIPGTPPVTLTLNGQGPIDDWRASVRAALDDQQRLAMDLSHRLGPDGRHVALKGAGDFADLLPPDLRGLFKGSTSLDLAALVGDGGAVTVERGSIQTDSLSLTASGRYDPKGANDLKAIATGKQGPVRFRWPLADGELSAAFDRLALDVTGDAAQASLKLNINLPELVLPQGRLAGLTLEASSSRFDLARRNGLIDTRLVIAEADPADPNLRRALTAPLTLTALLAVAGNTISTEDLDFSAQALSLRGQARYALESKRTSAALTLQARAETLPADLAGRFEGPIGLKAQITYDPASGLDIPTLALTSSLIDASGSAALTANVLTSRLEGRIKALDRLTPQARGAADFSLAATGPLSALNTTARLTIDKAEMAGRPLAGFTLDAKAQLGRTDPTANLTASGTLDGKPVKGLLDLASKDGRISLPNIRLDVGENTMEGKLMLSGAMLPTGRIGFTFPDLGLLAALGGQQAAGDLAGAVSFQENGGRIAATVTARGKGLNSNGVSMERPDINVSTSDLAALAIEGKAQAARISTGSALLENPALAFARRGSRTDITLSGRYDGAPLSGAVLVQQDVDMLSIQLSSFSASPRGIPVKLDGPGSIRVENGTATLDPIALTVGGGSVTLQGQAGRKLDMRAAIRALPASLANSFSAGLDAGGSISGTIAATGSSSNPDIAYELNWRDATLAQLKAAGLEPLALEARGNVRNQRLEVKSTLSGGGLSVSGGGSLSLAAPRAVDMSFDLRLPFQSVQGLLTAQGLALEGAANGTVKVGGSLSSPSLSGSISTSGAKIIDLKRNVALEGVSASVLLEGKRATLSAFSGRISAGGRVAAKGSIDLSGQGMPADISVQLQNAVYVDGDLVTATASGDLALKGPLVAGPTLSGKVRLDKTSITIPSKLPASISALNIRHRNAPQDVKRQMKAIQPKEASGTSSPLKLDLQVSAPSQIFVRGRGIDAELNGDVAIRGTAAAPEVTGGFTMRRGRIVILTKRLDFSEGKITFGGGLIPIIDFTASNTSGSTTLNATVEGVANDPQIGFSSSPALPQDEILAQLIFGQSLSKLSPLQIAQLADAVSQLAGGRSTSLFNSLRNSVGVDDLDVSTDSKGDAQVSAGKYLNDRTYLEFQQSSSGSRAVINLDVGRGFKLKGQAGANGDSGGGVFYEKEY